MIRYVEAFSTELERPILEDISVLQSREVDVSEVWAVNLVAARIAQSISGLLLESVEIDPLILVLVSWLKANAANLIRTIAIARVRLCSADG